MKTYDLKYPIGDQGREIRQIKLRRITVGDLETARKETEELAQTKILLTRVAELAPEEVDALDVHDYNQLSEILLGFLEDSPEPKIAG